jgi:putative oxidoreductase
MIKKLLSPNAVWGDYGLVAIRILTGLMIAYHGLEIFHRSAMMEYLKWDQIKALPAPELMVYVGKGIEFFAGVCLVLGLFTRIAALVMAINMLFIVFYIGNGRFYYEDQHPFLFAVLALIYFFAGPVRWGVDFILFKNSK